MKKRAASVIQKRIAEIITTRDFQTKHFKNIYVIVAHYESWVATKPEYQCNICKGAAPINEIYNKRHNIIVRGFSGKDFMCDATGKKDPKGGYFRQRKSLVQKICNSCLKEIEIELDTKFERRFCR